MKIKHPYLLLIVSLTLFASTFGSIPPRRLTLQKVCELYSLGFWDMQDFAEWVVDYGREPDPSSIVWVNLDHQVWVPYPAQVFFNGKSSGTLKVTTYFEVKDGRCEPRWRQIETDLITVFEPELIPSTEPNNYVVPIVPIDPNEIVEPIDLNTLVVRLEELSRSEPNNVMWQTLIDLTKIE